LFSFSVCLQQFWIFTMPPPREGWGVEGPVQSNHCEEKGRGVPLSGRSLSSKRSVSRQIIAGRTLNAVSDGTFAVTRITACAVTTTKSTNLPGVCIELRVLKKSVFLKTAKISGIENVYPRRKRRL